MFHQPCSEFDGVSKVMHQVSTIIYQLYYTSNPALTSYMRRINSLKAFYIIILQFTVICSVPCKSKRISDLETFLDTAHCCDYFLCVCLYSE